MNQQGHAELSPLIKLNWRSNRSIISFAKVISQTRKTYGNFRSRIGLVYLSKGLDVPSFVVKRQTLK
jgi:hypothetical protein